MPAITSDAPSIWPTLMTVARLREAETGRCSCSNARTRSARVMADTPRALSSSARSTAEASPSHVKRASRRVFSKGSTRIRTPAAGWRRAAAMAGRARPAQHTAATTHPGAGGQARRRHDAAAGSAAGAGGA